MPPHRIGMAPPPPRDNPVPALKQQIAEAIVRATDGWSQVNAAALLGIDQPRMSDLRRGELHRFSLDQLAQLLTRADAGVELHITSHARRRRWLFKPAD